MAPSFFKKFTIAITGDFGDGRGEKEIHRWVSAAGGTYTQKISRDVTHLVCSEEHYEKKAPKLQEARKIPSIKIVNFDWLEDSLLKKRALQTAPYLVKAVVKQKADMKEKKKAIRKKREKQSEGYHPYRDDTHFEYVVTLSRLNATSNCVETFVVKLFETDVEPHYYSCYAAHHFPGTPRPYTQVVAPVASSFEEALNKFTGFFTEKTMVAWDDRLQPVEDPHPLAFAYKKPDSGPYGRLPGHEEEELAERAEEWQEIIEQQQQLLKGEDSHPGGAPDESGGKGGAISCAQGVQ